MDPEWGWEWNRIWGTVAGTVGARIGARLGSMGPVALDHPGTVMEMALGAAVAGLGSVSAMGMASGSAMGLQTLSQLVLDHIQHRK